MILIFAPNYSWAKMWAEDHELGIGQWRWVTGVTDVMGYARRYGCPARFVLVSDDMTITDRQYVALAYLRATDALASRS
jgi:hypothetical protein